MFALPAFLALLQALGLALFAVESPSFLVMKKKFESSILAMTWLGRSDPTGDLEKMKQMQFTFIGLKDLLFSHEIKLAWRSLLVSVTLHLLLQFSGISGIFYYSNVIFQKNLGYSMEYATYLSVGLGAINWAGTLSTVFLVDRFGRRGMLLWSVCLQALMGLLICIFIPLRWYIPFIIAIYLYIASFATGLGCIPWIVMAELVS